MSISESYLTGLHRLAEKTASETLFNHVFIIAQDQRYAYLQCRAILDIIDEDNVCS